MIIIDHGNQTELLWKIQLSVIYNRYSCHCKSECRVRGLSEKKQQQKKKKQQQQKNKKTKKQKKNKQKKTTNKQKKNWTGTFENSADPDQTPQNMASVQGQHVSLNYRGVKG